MEKRLAVHFGAQLGGRIGGQWLGQIRFAFGGVRLIPVRAARAGIDHAANVGAARLVQDRDGARDARLIRVAGMLDTARDRGQRGLVKDVLHAPERPADRLGVRDIPLHEFHVVLDVCEVVQLPVLKLSRIRTRSPRATSASAMCDPMKPAPPVTK